MKILTVKSSDAGQRLDKYLKKSFPAATAGFLFKMLRKKNIVLNGKKSDGFDTLSTGDEIKVFFSDETFEKLRAGKNSGNGEASDKNRNPERNGIKIPVIFENEDIIFFNKPAGVLSQSDDSNGYSVNDYLIDYLKGKGVYHTTDNYRPSVCNRLDRNTSGLIMCAKTYIGARFLDECIKNHLMKKEYLALCHGRLSGEGILKGFYYKDKEKNKATVYEEGNVPDNLKGEVSLVETRYKVISGNDDYTVALVELITGKSHQIRVHMAGAGHPLAGDIKYGGKKYKDINYQILHSYRDTFPALLPDENGIFKDRFKDVLGKTFEAKAPAYFKLT